MKFNCVAVDSDKHSLDAVANYLATLPHFNPLIMFTDSIVALKSLMEMDNIDLLLMDIDMLAITEKELTALLRTKIRRIIITSTNQNHAFQAFEVDADAFLLKPYAISKFVNTINKLVSKKPVTEKREMVQNDFFFIKNKNEKFNMIKIKPEEIIAIESLQNYISIQTLNKKVVAHLTLTKIKEILKEQEHIMQVHRSFLISKRYIEEIESNTIKMFGNINITVGENYKNDLLSYIKENTIQTGRNAS
ncbi:response regulator transcription factor [Pedobacter frigiditerrae]|uniref:Response regulator transcription factor n=1 Tax=Pedobacter frigiditerrae TaxID=2530452 RepID=A0A4R0MKV6_9SPHI|nr:LytTR family DNA-binding domain-containing protein [Pedobacter frigiditerrae]TCC87289.1 response regulator transcription factor [Pedobacter frigiditerrae]